jgi:flagellar biosynthetic protein FlhB
LQEARRKGDVPKSSDISVAAGYAGLTLAFAMFGAGTVVELGTVLTVLLEQSDGLSRLLFDGPAQTPVLGLMLQMSGPLSIWFLLPAVAVLLSIAAQRGFVFAPSKLNPKLSRISLVANAKNKFGRRGLVEFLKSFAKLLIYSLCLALFLRMRFPEIQVTLHADPRFAAATLGRLGVEFMLIAVLVSAVIGVVDLLWQFTEYRIRNRMTRKELQDETKDSEGDPQLRQQRRYKAQEIAASNMAAEVRGASVVVVNPVHYAVALKWDGGAGTAPICVAKGVDGGALRIRRIAEEAGVPVREDPPTARSLYATVSIGEEIPETEYRAVAAAIRFAEHIRRKAKERMP